MAYVQSDDIILWKEMEKAIYGLYEPPWELKGVQPQQNGNTAFGMWQKKVWEALVFSIHNKILN